MGESIWKKEISLKRKPKAPEPEPELAGESGQSVWKKEISLRKRKARADAPPPVEAAPAEPKQSVWKKDVSLGRKKSRPKKDASDAEVARLVEMATRTVAPDFDRAPFEPVAPPTQLAEAVVAAEPDPAATRPEPVSADLSPVEALPVDAPGAPVSVPAPVAPLPVEPVAAEPAAVDPAPVPPPAVDPVSIELPPVAPPPVDAVPVELPPVAPPPVEPVPAASALVAEQQPAAEPVPADAPADVHLEAGPVEAWMEPQPAEPWLAEPELPPAPVEQTAVVVHPPVPATELPPLAAAKTPFWKKELSFSRRPKAEREPEAPSQPFWKKELSFSRRPKVAAGPIVPAGVHPPVPASELPPLPAAKTPFWKKELSLSRGPKQPKAAKAKRSFSLPQLSLPSLSRGGRHQVKRLVGLKVGGSQLAAARIANNGAAELLQVARAQLEPGVVVAGELRDPDTLAESLKAFFAANKLPRKNVRLGIASNRIGVRTFDIAGIDDAKQLENAIQFRAQETLPIPLDEAVLDYHVLEERVDDEGNPTKRVLLVVAYRELVDRYVSACKKAGITLSGIDLEAFALLRALSAPRPEGEPSDSALVAVAVGHERSTFAVSDGRVCEFTRVLDWGGLSLNKAIARALDLAPSEAEGVKRIVSLSSPDVPEGIAPEHYALAVDAVRKSVQSFVRELGSSLQFYQNQPGSLAFGEMVITGGTASLAGLAEELQRLLGLRVRVGDPLARLKITKKVAVDEQVGSLAVAIGLGIED